MNVVSNCVMFVQIFLGVPYRGALNDSGVLENGDLQNFSLKFPTLKPVLIYYTLRFIPSSAFQWSKHAWPWIIPKHDSMCFVLGLRPDVSASTRLPCLAYINVPLVTYCKIWYVSQFTAASRVSPCDSMAFLLNTALIDRSYEKFEV